MGAGASYAGDAEILDEVITRSRGEFRHTNSSKITSSTSTPANDPQSMQSPRVRQSPRHSELRGERSPRIRGLPSPKTGESKFSNLGKSPQN